MTKLKLNVGSSSSGWYIDATKRNIINLGTEVTEQAYIRAALIVDDDICSDYHEWLRASGFNLLLPNPTNEFVAEYYGVKPLWETDKSQGVVVRAEGEGDYYIVMECSKDVAGFRHTQIIVTAGGCFPEGPEYVEFFNKAIYDYALANHIKSKYPCPCGSDLMFRECCGKILE